MGSNPCGYCAGRLLKNLSLHFWNNMYFLGPLMAFLGGSEVEETTQVSQCGPRYHSTEASDRGAFDASSRQPADCHQPF
jgi:hypothetical protein